MRIALTGVSGFIGSFIARDLACAGHTVTGLVRKDSRRDHISECVDRLVIGDHADERCWPELLDGAECIIHNSLNGPAILEDRFDEHLQSNLVGSLRLLRASGPRQFIYISSVAVHHDMRPRWQGLIDEDHPTRPTHIYGALKAAVEVHLWADHYGEGRHACSIRPTAVYGIDPKLERSHGYNTVKSLAAGEPFTKPGGGKFVYIDDVAAAVTAAVGNPESSGRIYDLVDCYARWADWAVIAAELLGVKDVPIGLTSPPQPKNTFSKDGAKSLGVKLDRGHEGFRTHLKELIGVMRERGVI